MKLVSSCQLMSQTVKNTEHIKYVYFLQKGANLERQYEDRVQKMLSELREVSRSMLKYISIANAVFVCYFLIIVFLIDLPVTIPKDIKCCICLLFCNNLVFG